MIRESRLITPLKGLICPSCEDVIMDSLITEKGILSVDVSYIKGVADIAYDPDVINEEKIKSILMEAGYPPCDKAVGGFLYDILTVLAAFVVFVLLKIIPLPHIPSLTQMGGGFYLNVFLIGLLTGPHCIVMCGGIMLSSSMESRRILSVLVYNISRVLTASLLGFVFGSLGKAIVFSDKARSMFYVFTGLYVIFSALKMWGLPIARKIDAAFPKVCLFKYGRGNTTPVLLGALTALLPCSASSTMWLTALSLPGGIDGALMMAIWSLGTLPAMFLFGILSKREKGKYYGLTTRLNIVLLLTLGLRLVIMGM